MQVFFNVTCSTIFSNRKDTAGGGRRVRHMCDRSFQAKFSVSMNVHTVAVNPGTTWVLTASRRHRTRSV